MSGSLSPDTSIYAKPGPSPMEQLQQMAGVQNTVNQNKLFQMNIAAQQAMGPIMQQSVDPATGHFDPNKAAVLMAQDPRTAFKVPEYLQQLAQNGKLQADTLKTHADMVMSQTSNMLNKHVVPLMEMGPNITRQDLQQKLATAVSIGDVPPEMAWNYFNSAPDDKQFTGADGKLHNNLELWVKQYGVGMMDANDRIKSLFGEPTITDVGGAKISTQANRLEGTINQAGGNRAVMENTPTPGERFAPVEVVGPNGATQTVGRGEVIPMPGAVPGNANVPGAMPSIAAPPGAAAASQVTPAPPPSIAPSSVAQPAPQGVPPAAPRNNQSKVSPEQQSALESFTKHEDLLNSQVQPAMNAYKVIGILQSLAKETAPGGGGLREETIRAGQSLAGMPGFGAIGEAMQGGDPSAIAESVKLLSTQALQALKGLIPGHEAASTIDKFQQNSMPNIGTPAKAYMAMLQQLKQQYALPIIEQQLLAHARETHQLNPLTWPATWTKLAINNHLNSPSFDPDLMMSGMFRGSK